MVMWDDDRYWLPTWREIATEGAWWLGIGLVVWLSIWTGHAHGSAEKTEAWAEALYEARVARDQADGLAERLAGHLGVSEKAVRVCLMTDGQLTTLLGETPARVEWSRNVLAGRGP